MCMQLELTESRHGYPEKPSMGWDHLASTGNVHCQAPTYPNRGFTHKAPVVPSGTVVALPRRGASSLWFRGALVLKSSLVTSLSPPHRIQTHTSCSSAGSSPSSKRHSRKRTMSASMRLFGVVWGLRDSPRTTLAAVLHVEADGAAERMVRSLAAFSPSR